MSNAAWGPTVYRTTSSTGGLSPHRRFVVCRRPTRCVRAIRHAAPSVAGHRRHVARDDERVRGARVGREAASRPEAAGHGGAARRVERHDLQDLQPSGDARDGLRERHGPTFGNDEDAQPLPDR